jgi:hypothetical protein
MQQLPTPVTVMTGATAVAWIPAIDTYLRMGASLIAIVSGLFVIAVAIRQLRNK